MPATFLTAACPPSLPSVPTSRATRVTSDANEPSCWTILFTVLAVLRNSPSSGRASKSSAIVFDKSPLATAPMTRAISLVGCTRSLIMALTESMVPAQAPLNEPWNARCLIFPSLPTTRLILSISPVIPSSWSITALNVSPTFPPRPIQLEGSRTLKSP